MGHGIDDEPHLRAAPHLPPSPPGQALNDEPTDASPLAPGQGVGDEPGLSAPVGVTTYRDHLEAGQRRTSASTTWLATLIAALAAGPWAILAAVFGTSADTQGVAMVVVGPLCEEVAKVAIAFLIVERWPWLFRWRFQVLLAAIAGGLVFSVIENLLYLHVYIADPEPWMVQWRWSVCVALHTGCSLIAGLGVTRVWSQCWRTHQTPDGNHAIPFIALAALIHGTYNFLALTGSVAMR
jgi:RsiW-degrading membrane proteinase PrsW (M82 family)